MAKRRMPPHIVLPNGQWRFVKRGSKSRARKSRGGRMVKHRKGRRHSRGGMGGIKALLIPFLGGVAVGTVSDKIPMVQNVPYNDVASGALVGVVVKRNLMGAVAGAAGGAVGSHVVRTAINTGGKSFYQ